MLKKVILFFKTILTALRPRFSFHFVAYTVMMLFVVFSVIRIVQAATPNPGHPWAELGDGVFAVTNNQTGVRTYTFPDANATMLTTNAVVTVAQGGIGVGTLASNGILYGNGTGAVLALAVNAGATQCLTQASSGAPAWGACGGGAGTVTNTGGNLTANAVVIGAGTVDTKVLAGINVSGTSSLILGVNTTTIGTIKLFGNTSGDVTLTPNAVAGTATTQTLPATSGILVNTVTTANGVSASNTDGALSFTLGAITPTTVNGNTFTAGTYTLTGTAGKTLTFSNTLTLAGTDSSTLNIGAGGTLGSNAYTSTAYAPLASPTFTGTVTIPTPFTIGAVSMTSTGTQLNYLASATGTTGTTSTNLVFSTSPVLTTPNIGAATFSTLTGGTASTITFANTSTGSIQDAISIRNGGTTTGTGNRINFITGTSLQSARINSVLTSATAGDLVFSTMTGSTLAEAGRFTGVGDLTVVGTVSSTPQGTLYGTATGSITSAQLATSLTDETGTGSAVFSTSPTLVTPVLGVASATSLATSAATPFLLTNGQLVNIALTSQTVGATTLTIPDFAGVVDEFTFKTKSQTLSNKTFVAPVLGAAAATSINGLTLTSSTGTISITNAKTLAVTNTLTFSGTDSSTLNIGGGGTLGTNAYTSTAYAPLDSPTFTGTVSSTTGAVVLGQAGNGNGQLTFNNAINAFTQTFIGSNPGASIEYVLPTTAPTVGQVLSSTAPSGGVATLSWATSGGSGDMILASAQTITGAKTFGTIGGAVGKLIIAGATSGSTILDATAVAGAGTVTLPTTGTLATLAGNEALTNKTYNGNTFTAGTGVLTIAAVKTLTVSNTLTLAGTDSSTLNIGAGGTLGSNAYTSTAYAPLASPTFTGTVTIPTPFTIGAVSMTSTGTQLNYLASATGTTGTTSTNLVFSTSPTLVTPVLGVASGTSLSLSATASLALGTASSLAGQVTFKNATNAFTQTFTGSNPGASIEYILPTTAPTAGQVLSSTAPSAGVATLSWATSAGSGDMILASAQTITGAKTFNDTKFLLRNVANTFNGSFVNTNTADRIYTLPDITGTLALTASPTFTGTVTIPTPFTLGATSVTTTGIKLNYLTSATGTTGTASTNVVFSTSPTLVTPVLGVASATSLTVNTNGDSALFSTYKGASTDGKNIFIGGGGQSSVFDGGDSFTGSTNSSLGYNALFANTTGYDNTAIGSESLQVNTTGYGNSALGSLALSLNTFGHSNSAVGNEALSANTTGYQNTALGHGGLYLNTTGYQNVAVGGGSLAANTTGSKNTAIGQFALNNLNITANDGTGNNTAIGYSTGLGITTGVNNTIIGANVTGLSATLTNNIIIADGSGNQRININSSGNVDMAGTLTLGSGNVVQSDATGNILHDALTDCTDGQILKWATGGGEWGCAADSTGSGPTSKYLVTQHNISSTTATEVTGISTTLTAGTYVFKYSLIVQAAVATTGMGFGINYTGTATSFVATQYYLGTGTAASTGGLDDANTGIASEQIIEGSTTRVESTTVPNMNVITSVATTNANNYIAIEGVIVVSDGGDIELWHNSDSAAASSVMAGSSLVLIPITAGADLAEMYSTTDESIKAGDIVSLDSNLRAGVKKSDKQYDPNIFGIISTSPSLVMGTMDDSGAMPVMVALSGRVPVKVTTENGPIKIGDMLTSSSIPGVAMRATKSGQVIGQAMSEFSGEGVGKVMVFVKTDYWNGAKMSELLSGLSFSEDFVVNPPELIFMSKQMLASFIEQKEQLSVSINLSEISTDRVMAGLEIITPSLFAGIIYTDAVLASNADTIVFGSPIEFIIPPVFNKDTAGFAIIKNGSKKVRIDFDKPYITQPIVNTSISFESSDNMYDPDIDAFFNLNIQSIITDKSNTGFTIVVNKDTIRDIRFSWTAFSVKDVKIFESIIPGLMIENPSFVPESNEINTPQETIDEILEPTTEQIPIPETVQDDSGTPTLPEF